MAADKKAINFGKIKRYVTNRTAEFYLKTLNDSEKEEFKSAIDYICNVRRTKDLSDEYGINELENIKNRLTKFSPTREQFLIIKEINKQVKEDNLKIKRSRVRKKVPVIKPVINDKTVYERVSDTFWDLKTLMEEEGKTLSSKELEVVKKNMIILTNFIDAILQERVKFEILEAKKQAEELKMKIERLNSKIKV